MEELYCECCERKLDAKKAVWLELNWSTNQWRNQAMPEFPPEQSQGWFAFGKDCAAKKLSTSRQS